MKRLILTLILALCLTTGAAAQTRTVLTAAADVSLWLDWSQTSGFMRQGIEEGNLVLGSHPSTAGLAVYNLAALSLNTFAPRKVRPWINVATLIVELYSIRHNARFVGIRFTP